MRKAAYQSLGAFISTFHILNNDGNQSREDVCQDEDRILVPHSDSILRENSSDNGNVETTTADLNTEHRHSLHNGSDPMSESGIPIYPPALYGSNSETANCGTVSNSKLRESPILKLTDVEKSGCSSKEKGEERTKVKFNLVDEKVDLSRSECDGHECLSDGCGHEHAVGVVSCDSADCAGSEGGCSRVSSSICVREVSSEEKKQDEANTVGNMDAEGVKPCNSFRDLNNEGGEKAQNLPPTNIDPPASTEDSISQTSHDIRLRSSSAGAAVRRISVDSGFNPRHQREKALSVMNEGKRRRWSLDRCNMYSNNVPKVLQVLLLLFVVVMLVVMW